MTIQGYVVIQTGTFAVVWQRKHKHSDSSCTILSIHLDLSFLVHFQARTLPSIFYRLLSSHIGNPPRVNCIFGKQACSMPVTSISAKNIKREERITCCNQSVARNGVAAGLWSGENGMLDDGWRVISRDTSAGTGEREVALVSQKCCSHSEVFTIIPLRPSPHSMRKNLSLRRCPRLVTSRAEAVISWVTIKT